MNKALLLLLISSIQVFLIGGTWDTCLAQNVRSEVRPQREIVEEIEMIPSADRVLVQWSVAQPILNVNFILERKTPRSDYEFVAAIRSSRQLSYTLADYGPITEGTVSYRIRLQEYATYKPLGVSKALAIHWNEVSQLNVYPNPVSDIAFFQLPEGRFMDAWKVRVSSHDGQSVYQGRFQSSSSIRSRLDVQTYRPGTYFLHVSSENQHWVSKFVKF